MAPETEKMLSLKSAELLQQGFLLQRVVPPPQLMGLIAALRPQQTRLPLTRVGKDGDGGYLLPEDFEGITACFSPGVEANASFETDLQRRYGIGSHQADPSVDGPPEGFTPLSFTKKYVGAADWPRAISLTRWVTSCPEYRQPGDFLLQMDIEGAEYETLLAARRNVLRRFRIMAIEFHDVDGWAGRPFFRIVSALFAKLLQDFIVVHNHPNNYAGTVNIAGIEAPRVFELTLLRRDRAQPTGPCETFPHPLDRANDPDRPDLVLPRGWFGPAPRPRPAPAA